MSRQLDSLMTSRLTDWKSRQHDAKKTGSKDKESVD